MKSRYEIASLFETEKMKEYIFDKFYELTPDQICSTVYGSRAVLRRKADIFKLLEKECPKREYEMCTVMMEDALEHMRPQKGAVYVVIENGWDLKYFRENEKYCGIFQTLERAIEFIIENGNKEIYDDSEGMLLHWNYVEKWGLNKRGEWEEIIEYEVMDDGKIVYCHWNDDDKERLVSHYHEPNLPIPFRTGDIIVVDCRPHLPRRLGVLTEIGDNCDCCCVQCLYITKDGYIDVGALKHKSTFKDLIHSYDVVSPLFRLEKFCGEMQGQNGLLRNISRFINGSEEKGRRLTAFIWEKEEYGRMQQGISWECIKTEFLEKEGI